MTLAIHKPIYKSARFIFGMLTHTSFRLLPLFTAVLFTGLSATHAQNVITNGDFEATPGANDSTTTFPGWTEFSNSEGNTAKNGAVVHAGLNGSGTAARIDGALSGTLRQDVTGPAGSWKLELDFAMVDPGDSTGTVERGLNINLFHEVTGNRNINFSVVDGDGDGLGEVRVVSGTGTFVFHTILDDAVPFSIDGGITPNGLLSDPEDTLNVVHLTITGTYGSSSSYNITVSHSGGESSATNVQHWQNGAPTLTSNNIDRVCFAGNNAGTASYIVDNVSLVPEPGSTALLILGAVGMGATRRRRC